MPSVHQIVIGASTRDAITNMSIAIQKELLKHTTQAEIYAFLGGDHTISTEVKHINQMPVGDASDILIYHSSYGQPMLTSMLISRPEKIILIYHNITPAKYFQKIDPAFAEGLNWGREELFILRDRVEIVFSDSTFSAKELSDIGYRDIQVIPAGLRPTRLVGLELDIKLLGQLEHHFPDGFMLTVSQSLPHKRIELALQIVHLLRSVHRLKIGLVVAGPMRKPVYSAALTRYRERLPEAHVLFTGEISDQQLATLYSACELFLSTSDHEGLAIPPLEAMAFGAPVVARNCGAISETVGSGGMLVSPEVGACELAESVALVLRNEELSAQLRINGQRRVREVEQLDPSGEFVKAIGHLL